MSGPTARRGGRWRDYPSMVWLVVAGLVSLGYPLVEHSRWLLVHLVLLGALTHAAVVWSTHFAQALLKTDLDLDPPGRQSWRLATLFLGVSGVLLGVSLQRWAVALVAAALVVLAVGWHALALWRRARACLGGRFRVVVHYYLAAAAWVPVGATFGVLLARGPQDQWHGRLLVAHTAAMGLGWLGLTVTGTLVTFWPTILRTRMDTRASRWATGALIPLVGSVVVVAGGSLLGSRAVTAIGLGGYLVAGWWWARALWAPARARAPRELAPLSVAAALGWAVFAVGWVLGSVLLRADWAEVGDTYGVPTAALAAGFAPQILVGAMSYLVPSVLGGGPAAVREAQDRLERWAVLRLLVVNGGLVLSLLPVPGAVRVATTALVLAAYAAFVPLLGLAVRAGVRARGRGRAPHRPGATTAPVARRPLWSSGQLVAGVGALALAVCAGVLVDPAAAGYAVPGASGGPGAGTAAASGHTTTVHVVAKDMRYDPAVVTLPAGDRLVVDLVNADPTTSHDLVFGNGRATPRLRPGTSAMVDVGLVDAPMDGWCSVVGHRQRGMTLTVQVLGGPSGSVAGGGVRHGDAGAPGVAATAGPPPGPVDLHGPPGADIAPVDAALAPASADRTHRVTLTVKEIELPVAPGVWQRRWTFDGVVPGPTLRGTVGDAFEVTLVNDGSMGHSVDFHAGSLAPDGPMRTIAPGQSLEYRFTATRAGIWMYHCATMPMSAHLAAGLVGAVVIDPADLAPVDREYLLVQSEVYLGADHRAGSASEVDAAKVDAEQPDAVVFNGIADQYDRHPLTARVGQRVRLWILDAGPNRATSLHVVGGQFDTAYAEGAWLLRAAPGGPDAPGGSQALSLAAAQGGFVELVFPEAGHYPVVSHVMVDAERGAHGVIEVTR